MTKLVTAVGQTLAHYENLERPGEGGLDVGIKAKEVEVNLGLGHTAFPSVFLGYLRAFGRFKKEVRRES